MSKHDGASNEYKISARVGILLQGLFYANVLVCFCSLCLGVYLPRIFGVLQILLPIIYFMFEFIDDHFLWYVAEKTRRKLWMSDGYAKLFCKDYTEEYYNNTIPASILRLAANSFESAFFTTQISKKMLLGSIIKIVFAITAFLTVCLSQCDYRLIALLAQIIFSGRILLGACKLVIFYFRVQRIYDEMFRSFITNECALRKKYLHHFFDLMIEYECLKSFYQLRLSSRIFKKMNAQLTVEWDSIQRKIKYAPSATNGKIEDK